MTVKSIKHSKEKRVLIPSQEEAGSESASPKVKGGKEKAEFPKNPIVHRGQDPELFWMNKYGHDDREKLLSVDIRSLYRHEHIAPETIIQKLYNVKEVSQEQMNLFESFGNGLNLDEIEKVSEYYKHADGWSNRIIQGDSLLVMTSLLEREGMAGKIQTIYIDPPYGIKYGSNWQMKLNNRNVKDGDDTDLTGEPEQIKAYRDTWELGIHSYLSYLRDRLLISKELLTESGSCFVQISDENVHLVRNIMDEVFGSENFVALVCFAKTSTFSTNLLSRSHDYLLWYAKSIETIKFRRLYIPRVERTEGGTFNWVELPSGESRRLTSSERENYDPKLGRRFRASDLTSSGESRSGNQPFKVGGKEYLPAKGNHWKTTIEGMGKLMKSNRIIINGNNLAFKRYENDFPYMVIGDVWEDTILGTFSEKFYVVQTNDLPIQRCLLMTTDPGDLVLDPTCGSGTTAYVAEQWGRRWITIDTSRIALNIAKTRLLTATFPFFKLYDEAGNDIRQGFIYKKVPHITLKSIANDEPPEEETLFDKPEIDKKKLRVSGPFTVETLQNFEPISPEELDKEIPDTDEIENFEERIFEHLKSAGVKNGIKNEQAVFIRIDHIHSGYLHAEGFYMGKGRDGALNRPKSGALGDSALPLIEKKAYFHIGPKFGTVSRQAVNEAVKECRKRGDADWLIILGFSFESNIENQNVTTSLGSFEVTKVRMHDDLMQDGLLKRDKKAASFVTIGEPDIKISEVRGQKADDSGKKKGSTRSVQVEICGLDIYDPITDEVKPRDVADIAYWMLDDDYDGSNFIVRQVFFCGGDKDEFDKWKKGLSDLAMAGTKRKAEMTLKIEMDEDAFARVYGHKSHPIEIKRKGQKIAVRVISQFGEESTKVLEI